MWSRAAVALAMAAAVMVAAWQLQPSEAARYTAAPATSDSDADTDALRFPGRPGSSRPRSPMPPSSLASPEPGRRRQLRRPAASRSIGAPDGFPLVPGFPGLPGAGGGGGGSPTECVAPLAGLMTCGTFLTGSEPETPTPQSDCCTGLGGFLNTSSAAAGDGNDRILRCLCPVILGDVNKMLPKPIDPVRLMYLPIACGIVLPPQVLYICFTGQQTPPLVGRIPDVWEKPSSAAVSP
ncbi:unnamed protein product [Urochloa decumbens]|uniref:Bifunctional inhibitor/plant lipid transfer protein/seed storage helical domain-containing protein n=1 Tax=Urochloa decumbens TaxID=240449 RepID=A0ABC9HF20_9POAL